MPDQPPHTFSKLAEELIGDLRRLPPNTPRRQVKRPTQAAGGLMEQLLVKHRIGHESVEHVLRERWPELVGAAIAAYSHPLVVEGKCLVVVASHAIVKNEIFLHREAVLRRLKKVPGCEGVTALNLRFG